MFFTDRPQDFEPLEKEQLDAMLAIWEQDLHRSRTSVPTWRTRSSSRPNARVGRLIVAGRMADRVAEYLSGAA